jgi:hypothetical protein
VINDDGPGASTLARRATPILIPRRGWRKRGAAFYPRPSTGDMRFGGALIAILGIGTVHAQDVTVAGRALDAATREPLPFATVAVLRDGIASVASLRMKPAVSCSKGSSAAAIPSVSASWGMPRPRGRCWSASATLGDRLVLQAQHRRSFRACARDRRQQSELRHRQPYLSDVGSVTHTGTEIVFSHDVGEHWQLSGSASNQFGIRHEIEGSGFDAVYENFYETQTVTVGMNYRF